MYISIEQAIDIYNDLIDAKNAVDGSRYILIPNIVQSSEEENRMLEKKLAEDFHSLCHIFAKKHGVSIRINGIDMHEWISRIRTDDFRFFFKANVEVKKLSA